MIRKILYLITLMFTIYSATAQTGTFDPSQNIEIGVDEKLDQYFADSIYLYNDEGEKVMINELINKPTILSFVYFRCPGICSPLMDGIAEVIGRSDMELAKDYQVFTISFDYSEPSRLATQKRTNYLNQIEGKTIDSSGWRFFTGDSLNITRATQSTGFKYKRAGADFIHSATLIILSPEGKITRYLHGTFFLPFEMKMAIVEAGQGKSGPTINRILQYCYTFDPKGQQYVLNITKISGTLILFVAIIVLLILLVKPKRKTSKNDQ